MLRCVLVAVTTAYSLLLGRLSGAGTNGSSGGSIAAGPSSGGLHFVRSGAGMGSNSEEKDSKSADLTTMLAASEAPLQPGMLFHFF